MTTFELILYGLAALAVNAGITYLITYLTKSAEYDAIKENIEEVTKSVEVIKGDINFLTTNRIGVATEIRNAILAYHSEFYKYLETITNFDVPFEMPDEKEQAIKSNITIMELNYLVAMNRIFLFLANDKIRELMDDLNVLMVEIRGDYFTTLTKWGVNFRNAKARTAMPPWENYAQIMEQALDDSLQIQKEWHTTMLEKYKKAKAFAAALEDLFREQIIQAFHKD